MSTKIWQVQKHKPSFDSKAVKSLMLPLDAYIKDSGQLVSTSEALTIGLEDSALISVA